jgi:hypothetical protein
MSEKCYFCKKKIGLINFHCKCNFNFCIKCKFPENHNCSYNYKKDGENELIKQLNKVVPNKIIKI